MPKAKPDQVIVHRIELQETERATLEAALAGRFVTNAVAGAGSVLSGIGSALAPFSGAISALAALWIADRTLDEILDAARDLGEKQKRENEESFEGWGAKAIGYVSALLTSTYENGGWPAVCALEQELIQDNMNPLDIHNKKHILIQPSWFAWVVINFLRSVCNESNPTSGISLQSNPVEIWDTWYSVEQYGKDAYYYSTNGTVWGGVKKTLFG